MVVGGKHVNSKQMLADSFNKSAACILEELMSDVEPNTDASIRSTSSFRGRAESALDDAKRDAGHEHGAYICPPPQNNHP
jgi:hypothetical protein